MVGRDARLNPAAAEPASITEWFRTSPAIVSGLEPSLTELVEIRAPGSPAAPTPTSARVAAGERVETEQRVHLLSARRKAPGYSDRERAALGWTEALTRLSEGHSHERKRPKYRLHQ